MAGKNVNLFSGESSNGDETSDGEGKQDNQHVFLCHSGKQKNFVRQLHRDLTNAGVSCFFDEDLQSLPLAHKFPLRIFQAIETCKDYPQWQALEISQEMRAEWQNAVREVRSYNGLVLREGENEVSFRDKVVKNLCSLLLLPQPPMLQPPPPQQAPKSSKVVHRMRVNPIRTSPASSTWFPFFSNFAHVLVL